HAGLELGLKRMDSERTTSVVLVTDGVANIGPKDHADFVSLIQAQDVRFFTFVMGNSANRPLLETIANASGGFALDVAMGDDIYGRILQAKNKVLYEALHDAKVRFSGGKTSNLTPAYKKTLYQGQQLTLFGHYQQPGPVSITFEAKISGKPQEWTVDTALPDHDADNPELERLWALSAVEDIMREINLRGESEDLRQKVVDIGEQYSVVTDYTSMVVLNDQEMEEQGLQRRNSSRIQKERIAQQKRNTAPVKPHRVDNSKNGAMFKGARSPGVGSGPVGPWFLALLAGCAVLVRRKLLKADC
ncbi:MAG: VIT domain-containing protein, partial [Desulfobulbia bacterium]